MMKKFEFKRVLSYWHKENRNLCSWRKTDDPYAILIAEILRDSRGETYACMRCSWLPTESEKISIDEVENRLSLLKSTYFRPLPFIASTKAKNGGDGLPGRDFISGWNCDPKKKGCSAISQISIRSPLVPENIMPLSSIC